MNKKCTYYIKKFEPFTSKLNKLFLFKIHFFAEFSSFLFFLLSLLFSFISCFFFFIFLLFSLFFYKCVIWRHPSSCPRTMFVILPAIIVLIYLFNKNVTLREIKNMNALVYAFLTILYHDFIIKPKVFTIITTFPINKRQKVTCGCT